eukprot:CAMPEP_0171544810 /NCGR_PEP_ID=MMETSP0960-20121227/3719_1 /TAXON_ID=87120 /ORGANISM="Aurantiochytrium limacinum, Strain ATCCMYA-1381" /LENGTH=34 /DNA_ID= /DNA_START= /DNA_END= /DNA_ORIENTATION=
MAQLGPEDLLDEILTYGLYLQTASAVLDSRSIDG